MTGYGMLTGVAQEMLLFGQARYIHMGRRFKQGGSSLEMEDLFVVGAVFAVVVALVWGLARFLRLREKQGHKSPRRLFAELCRAHHIGWTDRRLLRQLARWHQVPDTCQMFLEASLFDAHQLGPAFASRAGRVATLQDRLFAIADDPPQE